MGLSSADVRGTQEFVYNFYTYNLYTQLLLGIYLSTTLRTSTTYMCNLKTYNLLRTFDLYVLFLPKNLYELCTFRTRMLLKMF